MTDQDLNDWERGTTEMDGVRAQMGDEDFEVTLTDQELDDWLAEHVMGWHGEKSFGYQGGKPGWLLVDKYGGTGSRFEDWHPTEDANQALICLEKLVHDNWEMRLYSHYGNYYCDLWRQGHIEEDRCQKHDLSPARAICLAVYEAKKSLKKQEEKA